MGAAAGLRAGRNNRRGGRRESGSGSWARVEGQRGRALNGLNLMSGGVSTRAIRRSVISLNRADAPGVGVGQAVAHHVRRMRPDETSSGVAFYALCNMAKLLAPLLLLLMSSGCAAQMVSTRGNSKYGPINDTLGGQIRYLQGGATDAIQARREDAYRQMHRYCDGRYIITREWDVVDGQVSNVWANESVTAQASAYGGRRSTSVYGTAQTNLNSMAWTSNMVPRNIEFECESAPSQLRGEPKGRSRRTERSSAPYRAFFRRTGTSVPSRAERPKVESSAESGVSLPADLSASGGEAGGAEPSEELAVLHRRGRAFFAVGRFVDADRIALECLKLDAEYAPCHFIRFLVSRQQRDQEGALRSCRSFMEFAQVGAPVAELDECAGVLAQMDSFNVFGR